MIALGSMLLGAVAGALGVRIFDALSPATRALSNDEPPPLSSADLAKFLRDSGWRPEHMKVLKGGKNDAR